jgi:hypothetical protein
VPAKKSRPERARLHRDCFAGHAITASFLNRITAGAAGLALGDWAVVCAALRRGKQILCPHLPPKPHPHSFSLIHSTGCGHWSRGGSADRSVLSLCLSGCRADRILHVPDHDPNPARRVTLTLDWKFILTGAPDMQILLRKDGVREAARTSWPAVCRFSAASDVHPLGTTA